MQQHEQQPPRRLFTVEQFAARHPSFLTEPALRAYRFDARHDDRHGFGAAGAFVEIGRKVLIDEERFFAAISARQKPDATPQQAKAADDTTHRRSARAA